MAQSKVPAYQRYATQIPADTFAGNRTFANDVRIDGTLYVYGQATLNGVDDITDVTPTGSVAGSDTVNAATVLASINALETAVNDILTLLGKE